MEQNLELLKMQLLLRCLDQTQSAEFHAALIREAEAATCLARRTGFPTLIFPCLFEERVRAALEEQERAATQYWGALDCLSSSAGTALRA